MSEQLKIVTFEGVVGIERAEEIKAQLISIIDQNNSVVLNVSRVEWLDLSIVQLILSAKKTALTKHLSLKFAATISEPVIQAFHICGISQQKTFDGQELDQIIEEYLYEISEVV